MPSNILMFVEDPGAANYLMGLPPHFTKQGLTTHLVSAGNATGYLHERGIAAEDFTSSLLYPSPRSPSDYRIALIGTSENPDSPGLQLIKQCRSIGICSVGVVDAYANAAYRFRGRAQNALAYAPDWLIVPDSTTQDAFCSLGFPVDHILIGGHPHYDTIRAERDRLSQGERAILRQKWFPDAAPERPVLVFAAEISTGFAPAEFRRAPDYTLQGWGLNHGRTEIVLEEFIDAVASLQPLPYLVLRLHPKNTQEEFARYNDAFDKFSQGGVPLEMIYAADAIVGMTSMLLLEAALLDRPTLSILPRVCEREWLPSIRAGLTPCATTRPETHNLMHDLLTQIYLQSGIANTDIMNDRYSNIAEIMPSGSSERIAAFIAGLLSS